MIILMAPEIIAMMWNHCNTSDDANDASDDSAASQMSRTNDCGVDHNNDDDGHSKTHK